MRRRAFLSALGAGGASLALPGSSGAAPKLVYPTGSSYDTIVLGHQPKHYFQYLDLAAGRWIDVIAGKDGVFPAGYGTNVVANGELVPHFDGFGQYADMGDSSYFGPAGAKSAWTVEAWFRPDTLTFPRSESSGYVHWMGKGTWHNRNGGGDREWMARVYNEANAEDRKNWVSGYTSSFDGGPHGLACGQAFTGGIEAGEWYHFVYVTHHLTRKVALWLNGQQAHGWVSMDDAKYQVEIRNGSAPLRVGTRELQSFFQGSVAKLAFYTYQLSPERIAEHYAAGDPFLRGDCS